MGSPFFIKIFRFPNAQVLTPSFGVGAQKQAKNSPKIKGVPKSRAFVFELFFGHYSGVGETAEILKRLLHLHGYPFVTKSWDDLQKEFRSNQRVGVIWAPCDDFIF